MKISKKILALSLACVTGLGILSCSKSPSINVLSREEGSGTRSAFIELFGIEKKDANGKKIDHTTDDAAITNSTAVMLSTVAGDENAIGYVSLGSLNDSVKALKIDGVVPTTQNILSGSYKISRPFNIAVNSNLSAVARDFISFVMSADGQQIVEDNKYIRISDTGSYISSNMTGKVVLAGSSSVSPVMEKLTEKYKTLNPDVVIELQTSDSTTGVSSAINGTCDIGMASRALKSSEIEKGIQEITIALDGIAVIVNKANSVSDLTKADVENIFTGNVTDWSDVK